MTDEKQEYPTTSDPEIMGGQWCIAGTRVPARMIAKLQRDHGIHEVYKAYPFLTGEQVRHAWEFAQDHGFDEPRACDDPYEGQEPHVVEGERELSKSQQSVIRKAEASHEYAIAFIKSHFRNMGDIFTALNQATTEAGDCRAELATLRAERDELREALEPGAENEIAYLNDEVTFWITDIDGDGHAYRRREIVPWSAVEEIMAKIRARAALSTKGDGDD